MGVGDFNGDGKDDIVTFRINGPGDFLVALSSGSAFGNTFGWGGHVLPGEAITIGDFNYDRKDDVAVFTKGTTNDALVFLSSGAGFSAGVVWSGFIAPGSELPLAGDVDGDGYADIVSFSRGSTADVWVSISTGSSFNTRVKWHDTFCYGSEIPRVADVNGDGVDDIVTFTRGTTSNVFVAMSTQTGFSGNGALWHDYFGVGSELPFVGDVGSDGFADILLFKQITAEVLVSRAVP